MLQGTLISLPRPLRSALHPRSRRSRCCQERGRPFRHLQHGPFRDGTEYCGWSADCFPPMGGTLEYEHRLRVSTSLYHAAILKLLEDAVDGIEAGVPQIPSTDEARVTGDALLKRLLADRNEFIHKNQSALLTSLGPAASQMSNQRQGGVSNSRPRSLDLLPRAGASH